MHQGPILVLVRGTRYWVGAFHRLGKHPTLDLSSTPPFDAFSFSHRISLNYSVWYGLEIVSARPPKCFESQAWVTRLTRLCLFACWLVSLFADLWQDLVVQPRLASSFKGTVIAPLGHHPRPAKHCCKLPAYINFLSLKQSCVIGEQTEACTV